MEDRNPEIPPDVLTDDKIRGDAIGSTTYSERWLLKTLMNLIQELPKYSFEDVNITVLQDDLEQQLCTLWDTTVEKDVVVKLQQLGAINILTDVISSSNSSRLTEIAIGILGNMCYVPEVCSDIMTNEKLVELIKSHLFSSDIPTASEVVRFITTSMWSWKKLETTDNKSAWLTVLKEPEVVSQLYFILKNSRSGEFLQRCTQLLLSLSADWAVESENFFREHVCFDEAVDYICEASEEVNKCKETRIVEDFQKNAVSCIDIILSAKNNNSIERNSKCVVSLCLDTLNIYLSEVIEESDKSGDYAADSVSVLLQTDVSFSCFSLVLHIVSHLLKKSLSVNKAFISYVLHTTQLVIQKKELNKLVDCVSDEKCLDGFIFCLKEQNDLINLLKEDLEEESDLCKALTKIESQEEKT